MRRILFTLVQLTWGLPQTLLGFLLYQAASLPNNVFSPPTNKRAALPLRPPGGFQSGAAAGRLKLPEQGDEKAEPVEWEWKY